MGRWRVGNPTILQVDGSRGSYLSVTNQKDALLVLILIFDKAMEVALSPHPDDRFSQLEVSRDPVGFSWASFGRKLLLPSYSP